VVIHLSCHPEQREGSMHSPASCTDPSPQRTRLRMTRHLLARHLLTRRVFIAATSFPLPHPSNWQNCGALPSRLTERRGVGGQGRCGSFSVGDVACCVSLGIGLKLCRPEA